MLGCSLVEERMPAPRRKNDRMIVLFVWRRKGESSTFGVAVALGCCVSRSEQRCTSSRVCFVAYVAAVYLTQRGVDEGSLTC